MRRIGGPRRIRQIRPGRQLGDPARIPHLWKPGRNSYYRIEALLLTGSGKLDVKTLRQQAAALAAAPASGTAEKIEP